MLFTRTTESSQQRVGSALGISLAIHAAAIALAVVLALRPHVSPAVTRVMSDALPMDIVWLNLPGPGGGGGGGGSQSPKPPRQAQQPGHDKITVPAVKPAPVAIAPEVKDTEPPVQAVDAPVETLASASIPIAGVIESGMLDSDSRGPGRGPGAGTGDGSGIGPGQGPGLGKGRGGGCCEGAYRPGSGIELPRLLKEVKPIYTAPAMRAKIQGTVVLECVVGPDGAVGSMRVVRSLDHSSGLDEEAMKAARQWQFAPGRRFGEPVAVLVTIEITFNLR